MAKDTIPLPDEKHLHLAIDRKLVDKVDDFRWKKRLPSRKDAIETLLKRGLEQKD